MLCKVFMAPLWLIQISYDFQMDKILLFFMIISHCSSLENIHLGLTGFYTNYAPPYQIYKLGSAMHIALDTIKQNSSILKNVTLTFEFADDGCREKTSLGALVTLVRDHHIDAVIGPCCSGSGMGIGKLSSYWNIPVVAYSGTIDELSDKKIYDTYSRVVSIGTTPGFVASSVVDALEWDKLCIYIRNEAYLMHLSEGILRSAKERNITILKPIVPIISSSFNYYQTYDSSDWERARREQRPSMKQLKTFCRGKRLVLKIYDFCTS